MKFGLSLPVSGPLAEAELIGIIASEAESLGFDSVWVHDHITYDLDWLEHRSSGLINKIENITPDFYESITTLSYVAGITRNIKLGIAILVLPLRDPRILARQVMTLQSISKGRLLLGVGLGDYPSDFRVMDIAYSKRSIIFEENMKALLSILPGGRVNYYSKDLIIKDGAFFPKVDTIPIFLGGGIRKEPETEKYMLVDLTLNRIAKYSLGWIPEGPPEIISEGIQKIKTIVIGKGRKEFPFEVRAASPMYIGDDEKGYRVIGRNNEYELIGSISNIKKKIDSYNKAGVNSINIRCWAEDKEITIDMIRSFAKNFILSI